MHGAKGGVEDLYCSRGSCPTGLCMENLVRWTAFECSHAGSTTGSRESLAGEAVGGYEIALPDVHFVR